LTGSLIIQESTKLAGRPVTLTGQSDGSDHTAWITRSNLITLHAALTVPGASFTLTLHDTRTFTVVPAQDGNGPISAIPLPAYKSLRPADPSSDHWYALQTLRLIEV
jgi:hypothetical protein